MRFAKDRMSGSERMEALFHYEQPDRVPINMITVGFPCRNAGIKVSVGYSDPEKYYQAYVWTADQYGWDTIPGTCPHVVFGATDFGGEARLPEGEYEGGMVITRNPVETPEDVDALAPPAPAAIDRLKSALAYGRLQQENGHPVSFVTRSPFTVATNICGLAQFSKWMIRKPELCDRLIQLAQDHIVNVLRMWVDAFGADRIIFLMSSPCESNQVISPKQFERFALPHHVALHEKIQEMGVERFWFHVCGEQNKNLPMLAEAAPWTHPAILSFGHEVALSTAGERFPQDILFGNMEPAVIQSGTPQTVYDLACDVVDQGKKAPAGFVLAAGCELPIAAPPVNLYAITKAVADHGWYE